MEVILAIAIFAIFSIGVFYLAVDTVQRDSNRSLNNEALLYVQEGVEAVRYLRDSNFLTLANGDFGLEYDGVAGWSFVQAPENVDDFFDRTITIEDVYRDENGDIAIAGGTLDPETKKVTVEVSWLRNGILPQSESLVTYLSNWRGDDWIQTTCTEFDNGTYTDTETTELAGPPNDNCGLKVLEIDVASEELLSVNLGKHANDVDVSGNYAYLAVDETNGGFAVIDVSDKQNLVTTDQINVVQKGRYVKYAGGYAYVGVANSNNALKVVNVSNPNSVSVSDTEALAGYGNQPNVTGNTLLMAVNDDDPAVISFDLSSPNDPVELDSIELGDDAHVITIDGNYAYVGTADDDEGFVVLDISDPSNLSVATTLDVGEEVNAIYLSGNLAFIGTEDSNASLHVVDVSNPLEPADLNSLDVGGEIVDITVNGDYLYAALDLSQSGLGVVNISSPLTPTMAYTSDILGKATGIASDADYIYVSTDTANKGLVIIGVTQQEVLLSGEYISAGLNTGSSDPLYNFIEWDAVEVAGGEVKVQLRTADSLANLSGATWVGSDGTSDSYYTQSRTPIILDPASSGGQYVQFRVLIDSNGITSPVVESVRINYTP